MEAIVNMVVVVIALLLIFFIALLFYLGRKPLSPLDELKKYA